MKKRDRCKIDLGIRICRTLQESGCVNGTQRSWQARFRSSLRHQSTLARHEKSCPHPPLLSEELDSSAPTLLLCFHATPWEVALTQVTGGTNHRHFHGYKTDLQF